jgi:hypothetical protein
MPPFGEAYFVAPIHRHTAPKRVSKNSQSSSLASRTIGAKPTVETASARREKAPAHEGYGQAGAMAYCRSLA